MKKTNLFALGTLALALIFTGCSNGSVNTEAETETQSTGSEQTKNGSETTATTPVVTTSGTDSKTPDTTEKVTTLKVSDIKLKGGFKSSYPIDYNQSYSSIFYAPEEKGGYNWKDAVSFTPSRLPPAEGIEVKYLDEEEKYVPVWYEEENKSIHFYADKITTDKPEMRLALPADSSFFFSGMENIEIIDLSCFDTRNVTNMDSMFNCCSKLLELDVSNFDTSNVINMHHMFRYCRELRELDVSNFNTSNVINMQEMFRVCKKLTELDVSSFNTSNVINMQYMFGECRKLTELDVSSFDTRNVSGVDMDCMFFACENLLELDLSSFDTSKVTSFREVFHGCKSLRKINLSSLDTSKATSFSAMFYSCESLSELDVSNFDTSNVKDMYRMFADCSSLETIYVSKDFTTEKISGNYYSPRESFINCVKLKGGKGTVYSADHVDITYARIDGGPDSETPGYFTLKE